MNFIQYRIVVVSETKTSPVIEKLQALITASGGHESFSIVSSVPKNTDDVHAIVFVGLSRESLESEISNFTPMLGQIVIAIGDYQYDGEVNTKEENKRCPIQGFSKINICLGEKYFLSYGFGYQTRNFLDLFHYK